MKLFISLLILFFFLPVSCTVAVVGLRGAGKDFAPATVLSLGGEGGGPDMYVRAEGYLLRLGSPDSIRDGADYVFPFVDRATADRAVAEGRFGFSGAERPLVAIVRAKSLPVEAFARPPAGASEPVAIPYTLEGTRLVKRVKPSSHIARLTGLGAVREVVVLDGSLAEVSRVEGLVSGIIALVLLVTGVKLFRSWRRDRRRAREELGQFMERYDAERRASSGGASPAPASVSGARPKPGRSWDIPWGKFVGVLVVLGIIGARLGKTVAPAADNIVRGVVRSADEVTSAARSASKATPVLSPAAGRSLELPSAGELALEGIDQIPNVKTAAEAARSQRPEPAPAGASGRRSSDRVELTATVLESREVYKPIDSPGSDPAVARLLTCNLTAVKSVEEVDGKVSGMSRVARTHTSRELPDRDRGEFTRIELRPIEGGVRLSQVMAFSLDGGYVEVMRAAGDMQFVGGGTWLDLVGGEGPVLLEFTAEGTTEYARMAAAVMARVAEHSLAEQGMAGMTVDARYRQPPIQELLFEKGKLVLSQRGESTLEVRGRYR